VLTGRADFYFALPFQVARRSKEGKLARLAVGAAKAKRAFPDGPHHGRGRYPSSDYNFWIGALSRRKPRAYRGAPDKEINAAVAAPDVRRALLKLASIP